MGKKVNRAIVLMMAISLLLGSVTTYAAENQEPAIEEVELQAQNASSGRELVDGYISKYPERRLHFLTSQ